jgi:hypothetical protein
LISSYSEGKYKFQLEEIPGHRSPFLDAYVLPSTADFLYEEYNLNLQSPQKDPSPSHGMVGASPDVVI